MLYDPFDENSLNLSMLRDERMAALSFYLILFGFDHELKGSVRKPESIIIY